MTNQELKADLRDIRYYHTHKSMFERAEDTGFKNAVVKKTDRYAQAMSNAPPRLYALFIALYVSGKTQKATAQEWQVSEWYIRNIDRKLQTYLIKEMSGGLENQ